MIAAAAALALVACGRNRDAATTDTGTMASPPAAAQGTMSDTGSMGAGGTMGGGAMGTDTTMRDTAMRRDTAAKGGTGTSRSDTSGPTRGARGAGDTAGGASQSSASARNQSQSGVTDAKTGKSTLGKGVTKTTPTQGEPVTSKGDTIKRGGDSAGANRPPR